MRQLAAVLFAVSVALSAAASPQEGGWCGPWQWLDGRPGADTWNDAASWGGLIVAVGDRGAIALSADGVTWRRVESPVTSDLYAVSWGPRGLVAVGFAGVVLTSRDALHWVRRPTPTNRSLRGVADNGTEYLVVGRMDTVLASRDGTVWELRPGPEDYLDSVAWGNGMWVGVGYWWSADPNDEHGLIYVSQDGRTWRQLPVDPHQWLDDVVWTGGEFVAVGGISLAGRFQVTSSSAVMVSRDGESWVEEEGPARLLGGVAAHNSGVWAVGLDGVLVRRNQAGSWQEVATGLKANLNAVASLGHDLIVLGELGTIARIDATGSFAPVFPGAETGFYDACDLGDGRLLLAADRGRIMLRDVNGSLSEVYAGGDAASPVAVACGAPGAVAASGGPRLLFAPSPTEWHEVQPPSDQPLLDVAWNGRTFLAVGRDGAVVSSSDGEHWQTEDSGVAASLRGIAWDGSDWVVVGDAGTVVRSTSQGTWRREPTPTAARLEAVAVGFDGTEVAVGPDVTLARWDGTWHEAESPCLEWCRTVVWTGDRFVAGGGDWGWGGDTGGLGFFPPDFHGYTEMASSRDGRTWVAETPPTPMGLFGSVSTQKGPLLVGGAGAILSGGCARPLDDPLAERWLIPAVAAVDGLGGTAWRSEVAFANPGDAAVRVDAYLLPRADPPAPLRARSIELGPGEPRVLSDVVGGTFAADGEAGALLVAAEAPVAVTSETATRADGGRAGQAIPAIPEDDLIAAGDREWLVPVRAGSFRTNVGLANATDLDTTVLLELRDALGRPVSSQSIVLGPWQSQQIGPLDPSPTVGLGSASVEVLAGGPVAAYASVVDNATGDPTLVRSSRPVDGPLTVPAAAHLAGDLGTYWRTELGLLAPPGEDPQVEVELVERAAQGAEAVPLASLAVADGTVLLADDVVGGSGRETAGWLRLQPQGGSIVASSRTFTALGAGSVGQGVPLIGERDWFGQGETAVLTPLPLVWQGLGGERTNLGIVSSAEKASVIEVVLYDEHGQEIASHRVELGALGSLQLNRILDGVEVAAPGWATAELVSWTPGARFAAYASVVDSGTGDPVLVLARHPG